MNYQLKSELSVNEIIDASEKEPQYLLATTSFYEMEERNAFPAIQLEFYCHFKAWIDQLSAELGPASIHTLGWGDFPEESTGYYLAVWNRQGRTYELELQHEDRECPLIIVFRATTA